MHSSSIVFCTSEDLTSVDGQVRKIEGSSTVRCLPFSAIRDVKGDEVHQPQFASAYRTHVETCSKFKK
jgi:hypothetical protein